MMSVFEKLTVYHVSGKKLPEFPAEEDEVLLLLERVTEAKRISITVFIHLIN